MTTILYHENEVLADTKSLEIISGTSGAGMFVKGKKIFNNDKIIVTFSTRFHEKKLKKKY